METLGELYNRLFSYEDNGENVLFNSGRRNTVSNFHTKLSKDEEYKFNKWIRSTPWYKEFMGKYNEEPDLNTPDYDYRGAWKAGVVPSINKHDGMYHWDSKWKSEDHPTMWKQKFFDKYGYDPDDKGVTKEDWMKEKMFKRNKQ